MKLTAPVRAVSVVVAAAIFGMMVGYGVKASSDRKARASNSVTVSTTCGQVHTVFVFTNGIAETITAPNATITEPTSPDDDHLESAVCDGDSITWKAVTAPRPAPVNFHVFFDESPCSGDAYGAAYYTTSGTPPSTKTCMVQIAAPPNAPPNTAMSRSHKYEVVIDFANAAGKPSHRYLDPHVIVSGTGTGTPP
jgi:hypothetical protein